MVVRRTTDERRADALRFCDNLGFGATYAGMKLTLPRRDARGGCVGAGLTCLGV